MIDRDEVTFGNLITMKSNLGYGARDYLYYKRRCGNALATLNEIEYDDDTNAMYQVMQRRGRSDYYCQGIK
jgi:hypothetical protein